MALIKCRECGRQISSLAEKCPGCGCPVNAKKVVFSEVENKRVGKLGMYLLCIILVVMFFVIDNIDNRVKYSDRSHYSSASTDYDTPDYSTSKDDTSSAALFKKLEISNLSIKMGTHYNEVIYEVKNNNSFTIKGYFYMTFYDNLGNVIFHQITDIPSVSSGDTTISSMYISKDEYPSNYSRVKFTPATIIKDD